jgi:hypothetical protein
MVMISMLAGASVIFSFAAVPAAQHLCAAQSMVVPVSTTPVPKNAGQADGRLPDIGPKSRDPAVLLPECKETPRQKRRKRPSDYPMA